MSGCDCKFSTFSSYHINQKNCHLSVLYKLKDGSKLKCLITTTTGLGKTIYPLIEILEILKNIIQKDKMYVSENPSIIICTKKLGVVLGVRTFHVTELKGIVLKQLIEVKNQQVHVNDTRKETTSLETMNFLKIESSIKVDSDDWFKVKPKFLNVLRHVSSLIEDQSLFTFKMVADLLSTYIQMNRKKILADPNNQNMIFIENDKLSFALGVRAFHRCQIKFLIGTQLIPTSIKNNSTQTEHSYFSEIFEERKDVVLTNSFCQRNCRKIKFEDSSSLEEITPENTKHSTGDHRVSDTCNMKESDDEIMGIAKSNGVKCISCGDKKVVNLTLCRKCWTQSTKRTRKEGRINKGLKRKWIEIAHDDKQDDQCTICQEQRINAIFVHGGSGHQSTCYICAKRIWKHRNCPVCNKEIDNIVKIDKIT